jgi:hypothetical protein
MMLNARGLMQLHSYGWSLLSATLISSCTLDTNPASGSTTHEESIRVRDGGTTFASDLAADAGEEDDTFADGGRLTEPEPEPELAQGPCDPNPCANRGRCEASGVGFECACRAGFNGMLCEEICGDGARAASEACDEGPSNGSPGHCDRDCSRLVEELAILNPQRGEVVANPIFFDWELRARNPRTKYCAMLMTDRESTPEDRRGEQAFYVDSESEAIVTLSARRYRGAFSFAVVAVACDDPEATCAAPACISGSLCPLPCEGRTIVSESRWLRAVRP